MTQTEDVVGEAGRVGVVLLNPEIRLVIEQTIKNVRCVSHRGVDDLGMKGCVLVGNVSIEGDAGIVAVFQVYLTGGLAAASGTVSPSQTRSRGSVTVTVVPRPG